MHLSDYKQGYSYGTLTFLDERISMQEGLSVL